MTSLMIDEKDENGRRLGRRLGRRYILNCENGNGQTMIYELGRDIAIHHTGGGVQSVYVPIGTRLHVETI